MSGGLVVIGSGPAGLAAAKAFREAGGRGRVRMVSGDTDLPYDRPPLSKEFLRGETEEADLLLEPAAFYGEQDIETVLARHVAAFDLAERRIELDGGELLDFDQLVVAAGARPASLTVPGGDDAAVLHLRSLAEARVLRAAAAQARDAVVVGSGFIGCEAAMSLAARGLSVTLVTGDPSPQRTRLGAEASALIAGWLQDAGIEIKAGSAVTSIQKHDGQRGVSTERHGTLNADLVLVAAGIRSQSGAAAAAGLAVGEGRVEVDETLRTAVPGVFAAGDVALARNAAAGRAIATEHWDDAQNQGEIAGRNAAGATDTWSTVPSFWTDLGGRFLQYRGWGDGFDEVRHVTHGDDSATFWYGREGRVVGVLTYNSDDDDARAADLVEQGAPLPG